MKNKSPNIRTAKPDDYYSCMPLLSVLYHGDIGPDFKQTFESFIKNRDCTVLLAEHSSKVIGVLIGSCHIDIDFEGKTAKIDALIVDEAFRRKQIGRSLLCRFVMWARKKHCKALRSRVNMKNKTAQSFHENLGFTKAKTCEYILELQE
jgi:ribosomal protein S18 acetylase RimI-like enzyme